MVRVRMAEGGHSGGGPDLAWWQALLGGLGTLLMGWGIGLRRGRTQGDTELSRELVEFGRAEHAQTRGDVRTILDQMREERELQRGDFTKLLELVRDEGREQRTAIYVLGDKIKEGLTAIDKDVTRLLDRAPRRGPED